jgi:tripartite-type tricarboxylate transporter receptor subunit TctC
VPASASPDTVACFNKALVAALSSTEVKARLEALGVKHMSSSPNAMNRFARTQHERYWGALVKELHLNLD